MHFVKADYVRVNFCVHRIQRDLSRVIIWVTYWCFHEETNVGAVLRCPSLRKSLSRALSSWRTVLFTAPSYHAVVARVLILNRTRSSLVLSFLLYYLGQCIQATRGSGQLCSSGSTFELGQSFLEWRGCSWCNTVCKK